MYLLYLVHQISVGGYRLTKVTRHGKRRAIFSTSPVARAYVWECPTSPVARAYIWECPTSPVARAYVWECPTSPVARAYVWECPTSPVAHAYVWECPTSPVARAYVWECPTCAGNVGAKGVADGIPNTPQRRTEASEECQV